MATPDEKTLFLKIATRAIKRSTSSVIEPTETSKGFKPILEPEEKIDVYLRVTNPTSDDIHELARMTNQPIPDANINRIVWFRFKQTEPAGNPKQKTIPGTE